MSRPELLFRRLEPSDDLPLPSYQTEGAAGLDVRAGLSEPLLLEPGDRAAVPTGLAVAVPVGWELQVRPRSGLAWKQGITCLNSPGTIDSDYRGEVKVLLINHGRDTVRLERGERIAQLVLCPVGHAVVRLVDELPATERGEGGFGSTGR